MQYVVKNGQSIFDVVLQIGYPLEKTYELLRANNISAINATLLSGQIINFDQVNVQNFGFQRTLAGSSFVIATNELEDVYEPSAGVYDALLMENGGYLLQENNDRILI